MREGAIRLEEKNFQEEKHLMLDGLSWGIKNPRVLIDKSQKLLFIIIGEMFPDQQVDFFVIGMVQVSHI